MNINDMDLNSIFDLDPEETVDNTEEPAGEQEQEVADPEEMEDEAGEQEQDVADPADEDAEEEEKKPLTPQQRHQNAARRRAAEIEKVRQEERAKADERVHALVKKLGMKDPYNGNKPIETEEEYNALEKARADKALERDLRSGKLTAKQLRGVVSDMFDERVRAQAAPKEADTAEVDRQYAEIQSLDPYAPSLDELAKDPEYIEAVRQRGSMVEAYKQTHFKAALEAQARAATRDAAERAAGKAHLQRTGTRGSGAPVITKEMREAYRIFEPDITDDEIRKSEAEYNKSKNR